MIIEKFSRDARGVIEKACRKAVRYEHRFVTSWHLLSVLMEGSGGVAGEYFVRAGVDLSALGARIDGRLLTFPKAEVGMQQTPINRELEKVFISAEDIGAEAGGRNIGIPDIILGMLEIEEISAAILEAGGDRALLETGLKRGSERKAGSAAISTDEEGYLSRYGTDITEQARQGKLDPIVGRDHEIRMVIQVLSRRMKNNPILIGEPGVGKTAVAEGLAQRIVNGDVPEDLRFASLIALDMGRLIAGARYRGEFEERFKRVLEETAEAGDNILFIDEIHMLMGAGSSGGSMDAANLIKPALSRGEMRCMGSTTLEEYRKHIEKDTALMRRFQTVMVEETTIEETLSILRGIKEKYEAHHGVQILDEAISASVRLSHRYVTDRFLPDKAIDIMDQTAASMRIDMASKPEEIRLIDRNVVQLEIEVQALKNETDDAVRERLRRLKTELEGLKVKSAAMTEQWEQEKKAVLEARQARKDLEEARREMEQKIREEDFAGVAALQYKVIPECEKVLESRGDVDIGDTRFLRRAVGESDVAKTVSLWTGIPVSKMQETEKGRLLELEALLRRRVVGQDEALSAIAKAVRRAGASVQDPDRPLGSFLMLGPTGVGKTESARALAEFLFNDERAMIRIDMSEYMERHSAAMLVGAPPGYVGYEEGGVLTNKVRRKPYSVVLFDEVEKAHPDVFNLFLQLMDDGRLTDSGGRTVDFTNTIILMTSNLGSEHITPAENEEGALRMHEGVMAAVRAHFRPEFLNRLDDILVFRQLSRETMRPIVDIQLRRLQRFLDDRRIVLEVDGPARDYLANAGYNPLYGARPLKRVIRQRLQDSLADKVVSGEIDENQTVVVTVSDDDLVIQTRAQRFNPYNEG